jgi:hypothetical protein
MASNRGAAAPSLGALALALLFAAFVPAFALGAPPPGEGQLTIAPPALNFAATTVGANSPEGQIEVRNESGIAVAISNVSLQGAEPGEFSTGPDSCNRTLASGESCSIGVYFSPHGEGAKEAQVRIVSSDEAGEENVELSGTGAPAQLSFEPAGFDFGLQSTHGEGDAETEFQVRNTGPAPIHIDNIGFEGPGANSFNTGNTNCFGASLMPGEACNLQIRFRPQETIPYTANLRVAANGTNFTAALSGEGGEAIITPTPSPVSFAGVGVGSSGLTQTITLTNSGDLPGGFFLAFLTGGDVADFQLLSEDCTKAALDPGASCSAQVRFRPTSAGAKSTTLTFIAGGESGPLQIDLTGTGVDPALSLGPARLSFGMQGTGSAGQAQMATLTNSGVSPIEVDAATITGAGSDQFRLADSCGGAVLAPGAACQLAVRFSPDSEGLKSATLRVLAAGQKLTAALSGTAVAAGRVSLRLGSKPLRAKAGKLSAGALACEAQSTCTATARASIIVRLRVDGQLRLGRIALAPLRVALAPGATRALRFHLRSAARALLARGIGRSHLRLGYSWSAEEQTGKGLARRALR